LAHALGRHLVLVGFMGARKTTVGGGRRRLQRPFLDVDREVEAARCIWDLFEKEGRRLSASSSALRARAAAKAA
jgi:shikimate kinase